MIVKILKRIVIAALVIYGLLWAFSFKTYDTTLGISYSPDYARFLGLDHEEVFNAILSDLDPETIRLAVPWNKVEAVDNIFDFSEVDGMIKKAKANGTRVILTVGQKVPRWPECYVPLWAGSLDVQARRAALLEYVGKTIERYKDDPTIEYWQAENEAFIRFPFGECDLFDQRSVKEEVALIRRMDPERQIVMTDSGELSSYRRPSFMGDILGTTLYRTIRIGGKWMLHYDWIPPAFYKAKARVWGNDYAHFFVSELQAEPWFVGDIPKDQEGIAKDKSFDPERFVENVAYAKKVGASRTYLWGVEWWYFMKVKIGDDRYWETAKEIFKP